jgi:hypothetical protein
LDPKDSNLSLDASKYAIFGVEGENHVDMPPCLMTETGYEGWLNNSAISSYYLEQTRQLDKPIDCMWVVNVTKNWKVREGFLSCNYFVHSKLVYIRGMSKKTELFKQCANQHRERAAATERT